MPPKAKQVHQAGKPAAAHRATKAAKPKATRKPPKRAVPKRAYRKRTPLDLHYLARQREAERRGTPYFDRNARCFMQLDADGRRRRLAGLTAELSHRFFPNYRLPPGPSKGVGRAGGSKVHEDLTRRFSVDPTGQFRTDFARRVVDALEKEGLSVVEADRACAIGHRATAADLYCRDAHGNEFVVEVKSGMGHAFAGHPSRASGRMGAGLHKYSDSPLNQAFLQAVATAMMIERTYGKSPKPIVVQVDTDGVNVYGDTDGERTADFTAALAPFFASQAPIR